MFRFSATSAPRLASALLGLGLGLAAGRSAADRIEYADGRVMEGEIVRIDEEFVVIQDGTADFKIPRSVVNRIIEGSPADKWLRGAKAKLTAGDSEGAVQDLGEAVRQGVAPESLASVVVRFDRELAAAIPGLPTLRRDDVRAVLAAISGARLPRQEGVVLARIRLYLELGDVESASPLIDELQADFPEAFEVQRPAFVEWFEANIEECLATRRYDDALDFLTQLRRIDPDRAVETRILLVLQWGRRERDQGNFEKAIDIYIEQLLEISPEIARNRIVDALEQAEYADRAHENLGRTIALYERYGLKYAPSSSRGKLVQLWNELGYKHLHANRIDDARKAFTRVDAIKSGAAADGFLQCEHADRLAAMKEGDPIGQYELGEWCLANGLWVQARQAFLIASEADPIRPSAQAQLRFIDNTLHEKELSRLLQLYEDGKYLDVMNGVHEFKGRPLSKGFRQQAEQLEYLAKEAIRLTVAERPQAAEVLWQQAERAFFSRDYPAAQSLLRALIERYPDTPAGVRGEEFYRRVRPTLSLNHLETARSRSGGITSTAEGGTSAALADEIRRLRGRSAGAGAAEPAAPETPEAAPAESAAPSAQDAAAPEVSAEAPADPLESPAG